MSKERAIYFAGLMEEYLNIPSFVCENIENELINEKYNKVINYVIDRRKELENKSNYKTHQEIINMYLELQQENEKYKEVIDKLKMRISARIKKYQQKIDNEIDMGSQGDYFKICRYEENIKFLKDILKEVE